MNRKILFGGIAAMMIAAIAAVNVSRNSNESAMNDVALANVEALANESNPWYLWPLQGTTKDESSYEETYSWSYEVNLIILSWNASVLDVKESAVLGMRIVSQAHAIN